MSLRKLGSETIIYGLSNVLGRMLNFLLVTPFITRITSGEEFGVIGDLFFWTALLIALLVLRMDTAVFRFASRRENDAHRVFRRAQMLVLGLVVCIIGPMLLFRGALADFMNYPDRASYIVLVLVTIAFDALSAVPLARLRLEGRPWFFVVVNLGNVAVNLLLIYLLLSYWRGGGELFGQEYRAPYVVGYYLATITLAAAFRYFLLVADGLVRYRRPRPRGDVLDVKLKNPHVPGYREMLIYSLPLTLVACAGIINALAGPSIIKWYYGETVTGNLFWSGQFNGALKFAVILNLFVTAYNYAAEPFFFRQAGSDLNGADRTIYADAARAYALLGAFTCAAILLTLPWLQFYLGENVREGLFIVPWLLAGNFCLGLYSNFAIGYKLTDKTWLGGLIATAGSVVMVGGTLLFIDGYGILAPAASMAACYALMCVLAYLVTRRHFRVDYPLWRMFLYIVICTLAVLAVGWIEGADAGAMLGLRAVVLVALFLALAALERPWLRRTFLG